jgi:hypothetical protein
MRCQDCGGRCYGYDGGPAANYEYWVQVCIECGLYQDDDTGFDDDEYDDEPEEL